MQVTARYSIWRSLTRHGLAKGAILENLKMEATRLKWRLPDENEVLEIKTVLGEERAADMPSGSSPLN